MLGWRVTKYDPRLRDATGTFQGAEWTGLSDVGRFFGGRRLELDEYLRVENAYVSAATSFFSESGVSAVQVVELERYPERTDELHDQRLVLSVPEWLKEEEWFSGERIAEICRLILRDLVWCKLEARGQFHIHFGYDYYMYIESVESSTDAIRHARSIGLFVEEMESPYRSSIDEG